MGLAAAGQDEALIARLNELVKAKIEEAYNITVKQTRSQRLKELSAEAVAALCRVKRVRRMQIPSATTEIEAATVRGRILLASRASTVVTRAPCVRSPSAAGVLPRTHGSALFTRGETQALVVATLGTGRDEQIIDALAANTASASCSTTTCPVRHRRMRSRRYAEAS